MPDKLYLGDGCYATFDGYHVVLTTEDGIETTNTICLEPEVLKALDAFRIALAEKHNAPQYKP